MQLLVRKLSHGANSTLTTLSELELGPRTLPPRPSTRNWFIAALKPANFWHSEISSRPVSSLLFWCLFKRRREPVSCSRQSCNEDLRRFWRKEFIVGWKPVLIVHYTRPGTFINRPLHWAWIQYQAAHPKLISYTTPCKLACRLPQK